MLIALCIGLSMGTIHELLHVSTAKKLGCNIKKLNLLKNEVVIDTSHLNPKQIKKISNAPYKVLVPLNIIILILGVVLNSIGLMVGSGFVLFAHCISYFREGRPEENV